jgi:serine/threonine protein kinase
MSGFGEFATIVGLTSITLHKIHQGFVLLRTARNFGEDADRSRRSLEWEHYRYCVWEENWNAAEDEANDGSVILSAKRSMAAHLIEELTSIFPGGEKLEQRYRLVIEQSDEDIDEDSARGVLRKLSTHPKLRNKFELATAQAIHSQNGLIKRWRWAIWDKDRMKEYTQYVSVLVGRLLELTALDKPSMSESALVSMIRKAIMISVEDQDLQFVKSLKLAHGSASEEPTTTPLPDLKATRLEYSLDQVPSAGESLEAGGPPTDSNNILATKRKRSKQVQKLKMKSGLFQALPIPLEGFREIGEYQGEIMLVERKLVRFEGQTAVGIRSERLRHRIEGLVILLSQLKGPSFHALSLSGFFEEQDSVAFVYRLPLDVSAQPHAPDKLADAKVQDTEVTNVTAVTLRPRILTVREVVDNTQLTRADLFTRLSLARALAENVLQLHTAGWLHKAIRTDNVLLCNLRDDLWPRTDSFQGPFLAGYMFARENDPRETSDELPSSPKTDLYRHPSALGEARLSFRPEFDLYALGMVLLEIGLWKNLQEILPTVYEKLCLKHRYGIDDVFEQLDRCGRDSILNRLSFSNGRTYCDAVLLCLKPRSFFDQQSDDHENLDNSVRLQETILAKLSETFTDRACSRSE